MRLALIIVSLAMLIVASEARDRGQFAKSTPEMKTWFDSLKSGKGFLCCSDADGTAVGDVDWESKDGHYRVRLGGEWIDVLKPNSLKLRSSSRHLGNDRQALTGGFRASV